MSRPRLLYVVTHGMSARYLLRGQLAYMQAQGFEVAIAASPGPDLDAAARREGVRAFPIPIPREIEPLGDLRALVALVRCMRQWRPTIVNASTPKAGLLGMLAGRVTGVPGRIYGLRGLRLETAGGVQRAVLQMTERLASACAHRVLAVSRSLAAEYADLSLAPARKLTVLGEGSSNGIDVERFSAPGPEAVRRLRAELELPTDALVIGFVGRFVRDKGLPELVTAFGQLRERHPEARLLLLGAYEEGDPVPPSVVETIQRDARILTPGFVPDTAPYYALMDVLAFPSHREGFPNAPLEAAAAGVPTVGFEATGTVDAVHDGVTGTIVPLGDVEALAHALSRYLSDASLRTRHGRAAQERAAGVFAPERIWEALVQEYDRLLEARGLPRPARLPRTDPQPHTACV